MSNIRVLRSVFGDVVNRARVFNDASFFGVGRNNRPYIEKVDFGLDRLLFATQECPQSIVGSLDVLTGVYKDISRFLHETVQNPIEGLDFFSRNPKQEVPRFVDLLLQSRLSGDPIQVVFPTCPDYAGVGYQLKDDIGVIGQKVLRTLPILCSLFEEHGFVLNARIDLADVEVYDASILCATGETETSFLSKVEKTRNKIEAQIQSLSLGKNRVRVARMSQVFGDAGHDYAHDQLSISPQIAGAVFGSQAKVRDQLMAERNRLGDFAGIEDSLQKTMVSNELAGYAAYGNIIAGKAIIASPDAMSAIPAYHFSTVKPEEFSPVIYIKK